MPNVVTQHCIYIGPEKPRWGVANYVHTHNTSVYFLRDYVTIAMVIFSENLLFHV